MFTFEAFKGDTAYVLPHKLVDMNAAVKVADHLLADYTKLNILLNGKVIKSFTNNTVGTDDGVQIGQG